MSDSLSVSLFEEDACLSFSLPIILPFNPGAGPLMGGKIWSIVFNTLKQHEPHVLLVILTTREQKDRTSL